MEYSQAVNRLRILDGHIRQTDIAKSERKRGTLNLEEAQRNIFSMYSKLYFDMLSCGTASTQWETIKEQKATAQKTMIDTIRKLFDEGFITPKEICDDIDRFVSSSISIGLLNVAVGIMYASHFGLYCKTIKNLGTDKHKEDLMRGCAVEEIGSFCMTEIGHGSNIQAIECTATYEHELNEFIIHSPTDSSIKAWGEGLNSTSKKCVLFAQLIINKKNYGVHVFLIPIRDSFGKVYPGCKVGEISIKKGLHGLDNGYIQFVNYRVSKDALLDRFSWINENGEYESKLANPKQLASIAVSSLTAGRLGWTKSFAEFALRATSIALRYGTMRRQFSMNPKGPETAILDYKSHQFRLIPRFCESLIQFIGITKIYEKVLDKKIEGDQLINEKYTEFISNSSALASCLKAFTGWSAIEAVTESRRACGGNGFTKFSLFGDMQEMIDMGLTGEGDHYVILLKAAAYLLKKTAEAESAEFPNESNMEFMKQSIDDKEKSKYSVNCLRSQRNLFADKANYYCHHTLYNFKVMESKRVNQALPLSAINYFIDIRHIYIIDLCKAYYQFYIVKSYLEFLESFKDLNTKKIFEDILRLFIAYTMYKEADYFRSIIGDEEFDKIPSTITSLCGRLREEAILLTDSLPFPDKVMGVWGTKDLDGYSRFLSSVRAVPRVYERAPYWKKVPSTQTH